PAPHSTPQYTLPLHDALPISRGGRDILEPAIAPVAVEARGIEAGADVQIFAPVAIEISDSTAHAVEGMVQAGAAGDIGESAVPADRKSTRLNSSHQIISYAVF